MYLLLVYLLRHIKRVLSKSRRLSNTLLLIAHPDDELLFFYPLVSTSKDLTVLCLSDGNANCRIGEIQSMAGLFDFNLLLLNFKDNEEWCPNQIRRHLSRILTTKRYNQIVTFGPKGVSGHHNHISCYKAVKDLSGIKRYYLKEKGVFSKYFINYTYSNINITTPLRSFFMSFRAFMIYESQHEWYRVLYFLFSNYMTYNELVKY